MAAKHWDTELYESRFAFVWNFGAGLVDFLDPQSGERILDVGCGTGHLSWQIAERGALVTGLDADAAMVAQARINYPKVSFLLTDAASFTLPEPVDAVFSNAALHWVKDAEGAVASMWNALAPGGRLVAEFGGRGNAASVVEAARAETGIDGTPWFFPSLGAYASMLERRGFRVTHGFEIDRDTPLEGEHGMSDWLEMFGGPLLAAVPESERRGVADRIVERLRPTQWREGRWWVDYKRLRIRATRP